MPLSPVGGLTELALQLCTLPVLPLIIPLKLQSCLLILRHLEGQDTLTPPGDGAAQPLCFWAEPGR